MSANSTSHDFPDGLPHVTVSLNYSAPPANGDEAYYNAFNPNTDTNITTLPKECRVYNLRGYQPQLDIHGFCVVPAGQSREARFEDDDKVWEAGIYEQEMEELLLRHTDAKRVKIFDFTIRRQGLGEEGALKRAPVPKVHVDQSRSAAEKRVRDNCPTEADALLAPGKRFALCNVWRPLPEGSPVQDKPLAFADYRTIQESDFFPSKRLGNNHVGQTLGVQYSDRHRWYYLANQRHDEATIIKCFDNGPGAAVLVPHTAFTLPGEPPAGYKPRASIEARALLFF